MHTKAAIIAALAGLSAAAPAPAASIAPNHKFAMIAIASTTPIEGAAINANGRFFYIGKPTSAYCPPNVGIDCTASQGEVTVVTAQLNTESGLSMAVSVPGGQQAFVGPDGALSYTAPHGASTPQGSKSTPFEYIPRQSDGTVGALKFDNKDWSACPTGIQGQYQIFAAENTVPKTVGCIGFTIGTAEWAGKTAFEYT